MTAIHLVSANEVLKVLDFNKFHTKNVETRASKANVCESTSKAQVRLCYVMVVC